MQLVLICGRQRHACELGAGTRVADVRRIASEAFGLDRGTLKLVGWANRSDSDEIPIRASGKPLKVNVIGSATHVVESVRQASEVQRVADEEAKRLEKFEEERRRLREVAEAERRAAETAALAERRAAEEAERQRRRAELEEQRRAQMLARQLELNGPLRRVLRCAEPIGEPCEPNIQFNRQAELPPEILEAAMDPERTTPLLPLFLVLRNEDRVYYVGVSEFSAAPGSIRLPPAAMKDLQVAVGQSLSLESISPVQGESVAIRPLDETFFWIEPSERAALLEFELRQRQLVVEGEILDLYYLGGLFQVVVETTRPGNPISIINTDLVTEILQPLNPAPIRAVPVDGSCIVPDIPESQSNVMTFVVDGRVPQQLNVQCRFATGDCDLYISSTTREPSPANFDVCFQAAGEASVTHEFVPGRYFVAIHAWTAATGVELTIRPAEKTTGYAMDATVNTENMSTCPNCRRPIPAPSLQLHSLQCSRTMYFCEKCSRALSRTERAKHDALQHSQMHCECGFVAEQAALMVHRREQCKFRPTSCIYCPMRVHQVQRGPHQQICGLRDSTCRICYQQFKRKGSQTRLAHVSLSERADARDPSAHGTGA